MLLQIFFKEKVEGTWDMGKNLVTPNTLSSVTSSQHEIKSIGLGHRWDGWTCYGLSV